MVTKAELEEQIEEHVRHYARAMTRAVELRADGKITEAEYNYIFFDEGA